MAILASLLDCSGRRSLTRLCAASLLTCLAAAHAQTPPQTPPDAGALLRESRQQPTPPPQLPEVQAPRLLRDTGIKVQVRRFDIVGASRFDNAVLQARLTDLVGMELGFAQLQAAADRIAALYRDMGLHAAAVLPEQTLTDGVVRIIVIEGRLGVIKLESSVPAGRKLPLALVERMLQTGQVVGKVINTQALERATLLANELPGVRVSVILTAGAQTGETDIVAKLDARPLLAGAGTLDNQDARATGSAKIGLALSIASPLGFGDDAQLLANASEGKHYLRAAFSLPLGADGLRIAANVSTMRYRLVGEFKASGGEGRANTAGLALTYPLLRGVERNLYTSAVFDHQSLRNDSTAGNLSDKTADSLTLGLNGDSADQLGSGGVFIGGVQIGTGRINLDGNAADLAADAAGPRRNGSFSKFSANLGRLQRLSADGSLWLSASGQYAGKNLDSGQKFSLGGANGVRAYPSLEGSGDHGWLATVEYRYRLADTLQLNLFYDHGQVTRDRDPLPPAAGPLRYALKGAGVGLDWQVAGVGTLRALAASRIGSNPSAGLDGRDSDGSKRRPQLWLSASAPF